MHQDGSSEYDVVAKVAVAEIGSVVLVGYTSGNWSETNKGEFDFAACKLDADGNLLWKWQVTVQGVACPVLREGQSGVLRGRSIASGVFFSLCLAVAFCSDRR